MQAGSLGHHQHTALRSDWSSCSRHSLVPNAGGEGPRVPGPAVCRQQSTHRVWSHTQAHNSLADTRSSHPVYSPAAQHDALLYSPASSVDVAPAQQLPSLPTLVLQLMEIPAVQLPQALQQLEEGMYQQHQTLVQPSWDADNSDAGHQNSTGLATHSQQDIHVQAWIKLLSRLHEADVHPGPYLLHQLYSSHPPSLLRELCTPHDMAKLLICVLQVTSSRYRLSSERQRSGSLPRPIPVHQRSRRSWVRQALDVLLPSVGTPHLGAIKLTALLRALALHPDSNLPVAPFITAMYSHVQLAAAAASSASAVTDANGSGSLTSTSPLTRIELMPQLSLQLLQQFMWAVSKLVVDKGVPPPDESFLQVVRAQVDSCLNHPDASTPRVSLVRPSMSVCISLAHLKATGSAPLLQAVDQASQDLLPQLPVSLQADFLWASAVSGHCLSNNWIFNVVHNLHGAPSVPTKSLVQSVWALSVLLSHRNRLPARQSPHVAGQLSDDNSLLLHRTLPQLLERLQPQLFRLDGASLGTILSALAVLLPAPAASRELHPMCIQHAGFIEELLLCCGTSVHNTSSHMAISMLWSASCLGLSMPQPAHRSPLQGTSQVALVRTSSKRTTAVVKPAVLVTFVQAAAAHALTGLRDTSATDHTRLMTSLVMQGWETGLEWAQTAVEAFRSKLHLLPPAKLCQLLYGCGRAFTPHMITRARSKASNHPSARPSSPSKAGHAAPGGDTTPGTASLELGRFLLACAQRFSACTPSDGSRNGTAHVLSTAATAGSGLGTAAVLEQQDDQSSSSDTSQQDVLHNVADAAVGFAGVVAAYSSLIQQVISSHQHATTRALPHRDGISGSEAVQVVEEIQVQASRAVELLREVSERLVEQLAGQMQRLQEQGAVVETTALKPDMKEPRQREQAPSPRSLIAAITALMWFQHQIQTLDSLVMALSNLPRTQPRTTPPPPPPPPAQPDKPSSVDAWLHSTAPALQLRSPAARPNPVVSVDDTEGQRGTPSHVQQSQPEYGYGNVLLLPSHAVAQLRETLQASSGWHEVASLMQRMSMWIVLQLRKAEQIHASDVTSSGSLPGGSLTIMAGVLQAHAVLGITPAAELIDAMHAPFTAPMTDTLSVPVLVSIVRTDPGGAAALLTSLQAGDTTPHAQPRQQGTGLSLALALAAVLQPEQQTSSNTSSSVQEHDVQSAAPAAQTQPGDTSIANMGAATTSDAAGDSTVWITPASARPSTATVLGSSLSQALSAATLLQLADLLHVLAQQQDSGSPLSKEVKRAVVQVLESVPDSSWSTLELAGACRLYWSAARLGISEAACGPGPLEQHLAAQLTSCDLVQPPPGSQAATQQQQQLGAGVHAGQDGVELLVSMLWSAGRRAADAGGAPTRTRVGEAITSGNDSERVNSGQDTPPWCNHVAERLLQHVARNSRDVPLRHVCVIMWATSVLSQQVHQRVAQGRSTAKTHTTPTTALVDTQTQAGEVYANLHHLCQTRLFEALTPVINQCHWLQAGKFKLTSDAAVGNNSVPAFQESDGGSPAMLQVTFANVIAAAVSVARMQAVSRQAGAALPFPEVLKLALAAGMHTASPRALLSCLRMLTQWRIPLNKALMGQIRARVHRLAYQSRQHRPAATAQPTTTLSATDALALSVLLGLLGLRLPVPTKQQLCASLLGQLPAGSPQHVAHVVHALAGLQVLLEGSEAEKLLECVDKAIRSRSLQSSHICNILRALARLSSGQEWQPAQPLLQACCDALAPLLPQTRPQDMSHAVWALAKMQSPPSVAFMDAVQSRAQAAMLQGSIGVHPLAVLLYSFAALGYRPSAAWLTHFYTTTQAQLQLAAQPRAASKRLTTPRSQSVGPSMSRLMWAAAALRLRPPVSWMRRVVAAAGDDLASCWRHDLTLMAVGCALLGPSLSNTWLRAFHAAVKDQVLTGDLQARTQLMWAWRQLRDRVQLDRQEQLLAGGGSGVRCRRSSHGGIRLVPRRSELRLVLAGRSVRPVLGRTGTVGFRGRGRPGQGSK